MHVFWGIMLLLMSGAIGISSTIFIPYIINNCVNEVNSRKLHEAENSYGNFKKEAAAINDSIKVPIDIIDNRRPDSIIKEHVSFVVNNCKNDISKYHKDASIMKQYAEEGMGKAHRMNKLYRLAHKRQNIEMIKQKLGFKKRN